MDYAFAYDFNTNPVVTNVVESLLKFDADGALQPVLAESWEQVDELTYVYQIRPDVTFHDGTPLTAADVAASLSRIVDPEVGSYLANFTLNVASVEATGDLEVTVKLSQPDALWQYVPATTAGGVVPAAFLEEHASDIGTPAVGVIGTGPFVFDSWQPGQNVSLKANESYWDSSNQPEISDLKFVFLDSESTLIQALESGDIDGTFNPSGKSLNVLKESSTVDVLSSPSFAVRTVVYNSQRAPFDKAKVRQAIAAAIDRQGILDSSWGGNGQLVNSPATPSTWSFNRDQFEAAYAELPDWPTVVPDPAGAVEAAGAAGTTATILIATGQFDEIGLGVQAAAKEVGIDLQIEAVTYEQLLTRIADPAHDYDAFVVEWASDFPDPAGTLVQTFLPESPTNYSGFDDPVAADALRLSMTSSDPDERAQALITAQSIIVESQQWTTIFSPDVSVPMSKKLTGYQPIPMWFWESSWAASLSFVE